VVIFHGCHVPLGVTNVNLLVNLQITGLFAFVPTLFSVVVDVITNISKNPCDEVNVVLQVTLASESSSATFTWYFHLRVVHLLMNLQLTGLFTFIPTIFSVVVDVIAYIIENPSDEVHVFLQSILVIESSFTTTTWNFQLGVVLLLMPRQMVGLFTFIPTFFSVVVDVVAYIIEDACGEVLVFLQCTLALESSDTTCTWNFHLRVVRLLVIRQSTGRFKRHPTRFPILVNVITDMVEYPCDVFHVLSQLILVSEFSSATCTWNFRFRVVRLLVLRQITGRFKRHPTRFPIFARIVTCVIIYIFVCVFSVFFQSFRTREFFFTSRNRAPDMRVYPLLFDNITTW